MHVCGGGVARLAVVDDDHGPALAPELECGGKSGRRSADDDDVAVPLDRRGAWSLMTFTIRCTPKSARFLAVFANVGGAMAKLNEIEQVVRTRLRSLRNTLVLLLDELAAGASLSPSTISRIETGKRTNQP